MADRDFKQVNTNGRNHIDFTLQLLYAAGAPTFVEGDKGTVALPLVGSYFTLVQTGTGVLTITTNNPYPGFVGAKAAIMMATPNGNWIITQSKPTQNTNGTWSFTVNSALNSAGTHTATTIANGDGLMVDIKLRNSASLP